MPNKTIKLAEFWIYPSQTAAVAAHELVGGTVFNMLATPLKVTFETTEPEPEAPLDDEDEAPISFDGRDYYDPPDLEN